MKNRIWELDVFRGICIIGVVFVHLMYDLATLYKIIDWQYPAWFAFIKQWGVLPRKTFSMGDACDKRFYTEARKIL